MAVDMFIKITSSEGDVEGESVDSQHGGEIEVLSWAWGMSQSGSTHSGSGGGSGKVNVNDLSITKYIDKSTPTLMKICCNGTHLPEALLTIRKAGGTSPVEYVKLKLKECIVSSITTGGAGGGDRLTETVSLNFAEFHYEYTPQEADNTAGASIPIAWNIAQNVEV
ncbi:MAG: type VI secretion system tube protein TssD [Myxococcales bacterium]